MTSPLSFARRLAESEDLDDQALGVGIVARGLSDDDPVTLRQGWPLDWTTVEAAAQYVGLTPRPDLVQAALKVAPTISDAMLNKGLPR